MTDKTCSTCIWYDPYLQQKYGFCRDRQEWVIAQGTCEVHSDGKDSAKTGTANRMERL